VFPPEALLPLSLPAQHLNRLPALGHLLLILVHELVAVEGRKFRIEGLRFCVLGFLHFHQQRFDLTPSVGCWVLGFGFKD
jgi:hypothetical protein